MAIQKPLVLIEGDVQQKPSADSLDTSITGSAAALATTTTPVVTSGAVAPTVGQVLTATSSTTASWQTNGGGNVTGPLTSTLNAIPRYADTTGTSIKDSVITVDDIGNEIGLNSSQFNLLPTIPTTVGSLYWDAADGNQTLSLIMAGGNVTQQIGEEQYFRIKADAAITNGQVIMFSGTVGASGALKGMPATGLTASQASYIMGIATESIAVNGWGYVTSFGLVRGLDTTGGAEAWVDGQILYYNPAVAGGLTKTVPTAPTAKIQVCAVVFAHATNGSLFVRPAFGGALGQFEGDVQITSPVTGEVLTYNGSTWRNVSPTYNIEGGNPLSVYGGTTPINGGTP